jgi:hypothetical protein
MSQLNPFVENAVAIISEIEAEQPEGAIELRALAELLAAREPMLSPLNLDCAAREALRIAPQHRRERADIDGSPAAGLDLPIEQGEDA